MMNKYYLLENVPTAKNVIKDYATYNGGKAQLEKQLADQPALFDSGTISLLEQDFESRRDGKFLHLLVQGEDEDLASFESYLDSSDVAVSGAKITDTTSLDSLVRTYLPTDSKDKLKSFGRQTYAKAKDCVKFVDDSLATDLSIFGASLGGVGTIACAIGKYELQNDFALGKISDISSQLGMYNAGLMILGTVAALSIYGMARNLKQNY